MEIKYRSHAVERMTRRKISTQKIELILKEPDGQIKQSKDKYIYYKKIKGRTDNMLAAVAVIKKREHFEVITVMINFKVSK